MIIFSQTTTKLAVLAFVIAGLPVSAQVSAQKTQTAPVAAQKAQTAPVAAKVEAPKVDSKGGAQAAADKQKIAQKTVVAPAVKLAAVKPEVKPVAMPMAMPAAMPVAVPVVEKKADEPKMTLAITGQFTPEIAVISGKRYEADKDKLQGYNFGWNNAFVQFRGSAKSEYGVTFSAVMRLDASAMATRLVTGLNTDPTTSKVTPVLAPQPLPIFNRLFGMIEHENLGTITFGNTWGPQYTQQEGGFEILTIPGGLEGFDRPNNPYNNLARIPGSYGSVSGSASLFAVADPIRNTKLVYASPSLGGLKLSGAFAPRLDETGSTFAYTNDTIGNPNAARYQNSWMIVPSFKRSFGDFKIGLVGTYGGASYVKGDGSSETGDAAHQDARLWNISGGIKAMGFELGGQYTNSGVSGLTKNQSDTLKMDSGTGWNVAAAYNFFKKAKVGVMYMQTSRTLSDSDAAKVSCLTIYGDYKIAPGVKVLISENYMTGTAATKDASAVNLLGAGKTAADLGADTNSNVVFVGLDIVF